MKGSQSRGPFEQRKPSRAELKAAERRAAARAAARAEAMPPPDPTTRVDAVGLPLESAPSTGTPRRAPAPREPERATTRSEAAPDVSMSPPPVRAPRRRVPRPADTTHDTPPAERRRAASPFQPTQPTDPDTPTSDRVPAWRTVVAPRTGQVAVAALAAGAAGAVVAFCLGFGVGAPVLGHSFRWAPLAEGTAGLLIAGAVASRGWAHTRTRIRTAMVLVMTLVMIAFAWGAVSNTLVVHGKVFLSTSPQARDYQLLQRIRADLDRLQSLDVYLTYSDADAGAHYNDYQPAQDELTAMTNRYASYTGSALPDQHFAQVVADVKSAAYWASKAMAAKINYLNQSDAASSDQVTTFRTNFAQSWQAAGHDLQFLPSDLGLPFNTGVHE